MVEPQSSKLITRVRFSSPARRWVFPVRGKRGRACSHFPWGPSPQTPRCGWLLAVGGCGGLRPGRTGYALAVRTAHDQPRGAALGAFRSVGPPWKPRNQPQTLGAAPSRATTRAAWKAAQPTTDARGRTQPHHDVGRLESRATNHRRSGPHPAAPRRGPPGEPRNQPQTARGRTQPRHDVGRLESRGTDHAARQIALARHRARSAGQPRGRSRTGEAARPCRHLGAAGLGRGVLGRVVAVGDGGLMLRGELRGS
jgi:hypothetical protein